MPAVLRESDGWLFPPTSQLFLQFNCNPTSNQNHPPTWPGTRPHGPSLMTDESWMRQDPRGDPGRSDSAAAEIRRNAFITFATVSGITGTLSWSPPTRDFKF